MAVRVAAPLLGGVRGWVYFCETTDTGISAMRKPQEREFAKSTAVA
jgi:hypothetical protein